MTRKKILIGGYETWVEYNERRCCAVLFDTETAKHGLVLDVMGSHGHKYVNGFISIGVRLTDQEKKELNNHINQN